MRKTASAIAVIALLGAGCAGGTSGEGTTSVGPPSATTDQTSAPDDGATSTTDTRTADTTSTTASPQDAAAVIPAGCAAGFIEYLVLIEPAVSTFDPATSSLGEFFRYDEAVGALGTDLLAANDYHATYSCSEVGLEFAYFDSRSPWEAVLAIAGKEAPETVNYLDTLRQVSATEGPNLTDIGVGNCDDAVTVIKQAVAYQRGAGNETLAHMSVADSIELLGLYNAYMTDVRDEKCPRDVLGNDEWGFMQERLSG